MALRDEVIEVEGPNGMFPVIVTAGALSALRPYAGAFHDGASIVRLFRSMIAEIAREKRADALVDPDGWVRIDAVDVGD